MFNERDRRCAAVQLMLSTDPTYDNRPIASTLKIQIWIATNNRDVSRVMKTKFPATVMVFGVVSSEGHIMPPHIFEVGLKVNTKVYLDVLKSVVIPWCNQVADPGCGSRTRRRPTSPKRPRLGFRRSATTLYPSITGPPPLPNLNLLDYFVWSYVEKITNMTPHNTKASLIAAIRRVFAGACGKGILPVPDPYRGGDWGWRRLHWIDAPAQAESLLYSQEQEIRGIDLHVNSDKTKFMRFNQNGAIVSLKGKLQK